MKIRLLGTIAITVLMVVGCGKKEATGGSGKLDAEPGASVEQAGGPNHIENILVLAKKSAEEDGNINFCGFFVGMSRYDAADLAAYYKLAEDEFAVSAEPAKAVSHLWFSLKGVRRITKGGNTLDELVQAVEKHVGDLKEDSYTGEYVHKTIDGIIVRMGSKGLSIQNDGVASQNPVVTKVNRPKEAEAQKKEADAQRKTIQDLIGNMVDIPGKNFKMGRYEVTQKQWVAVMEENPSCFKNAGYPVEDVSWNDCQKFLEKLNAMPEVRASGLRFRLPTEAEGEYACRAGGRGDYCRLADGTEIVERTLDKVAWYFLNCGGKTTRPVGQKLPNAFGLYDMHGNVREWCEDVSMADRSHSHRVSRGGDFLNFAESCKADHRSSDTPDKRSGNVGFRLVASHN